QGRPLLHANNLTVPPPPAAFCHNRNCSDRSFAFWGRGKQCTISIKTLARLVPPHAVLDQRRSHLVRDSAGGDHSGTRLFRYLDMMRKAFARAASPAHCLKLS